MEVINSVRPNAEQMAGFTDTDVLGGSIDNASIVAANGTLFVSSGYGMFGQAPGNVLLAFRPKEASPQSEQ